MKPSDAVETIKDGLVQDLEDYLCEVVSCHPDLVQFVSTLTKKEIESHLLRHHRSLSLGLPVTPPQRFVSQVKVSLSPSEWSEVLSAVKGWGNVVMPDLELRANGLELHALATGLLWQTALVSEYGQRGKSKRRD